MIFQTLWENQHLIPEHWKGTANDPKHIFFDGTILKNQYGRYVISMYWDKGKKWRWTYCRLDIGGWKAEDLSAVIKRAEPLRRVERRRHHASHIILILPIICLPDFVIIISRFAAPGGTMGNTFSL